MITLLDCTLRDGGYINDWEFGHSNIVNIFERLVDSNVDAIEIGFLDERRPFDINRSIMPNTAAANEIYGHLDKKNAMVVAMIDYGTCGISNIQPASETCIDGIRVIFKKHLREPALAFCYELKELGYKVFAQLVSVTSYDDAEMMDLISLANMVKPDTVSMVDTYGLMHQNNLQHYFELLDTHLDPCIGVGYHGHNNFQMGYANCISMMQRADHTARNLVIDGTLFGMGKSAGNAPIELIAMQLNRLYDEKYNIDMMLEAIDGNIMQFTQSPAWGYNLLYFISALNDCHPSYVSYLLKKNTLSVKSVNDILRKLSAEKALLYDEKYIEQLYFDYQKNTINDDEALCDLYSIIKDRNILLVGPGASVDENLASIRNYIDDKKPIVITINCLHPEMKEDYVFLCNAKRYIQLASGLSKEKHHIIATSNITKSGKNEFEFMLNYEGLLDQAPVVADSAMIMLFKLLFAGKCSSVALAGLDGYTHYAAEQFSKEKGAEKIVNLSQYINEYIHDFIKANKGNTEIKYLTASLFDYE